MMPKTNGSVTRRAHHTAVGDRIAMKLRITSSDLLWCSGKREADRQICLRSLFSLIRLASPIPAWGGLRKGDGMGGPASAPIARIVKRERCRWQCRCWHTFACKVWRRGRMPTARGENAQCYTTWPKSWAECRTDPTQPACEREFHLQRALGVVCRPLVAGPAESANDA